MSKYNEIEQLGDLRGKGNISQEEYELEKQSILKNQNSSHGSLGMDPKTYSVLLHLSAFMFGSIGPIVMWAIGKDKDSFVDHHGKESANFHISFIIYYFISAILIFVFIGVFLLIGLAFLQFILIIVAAFNASNGEYYRFPLTIRFIK